MVILWYYNRKSQPGQSFFSHIQRIFSLFLLPLEEMCKFQFDVHSYRRGGYYPPAEKCSIFRIFRRKIIIYRLRRWHFVLQNARADDIRPYIVLLSNCAINCNLTVLKDESPGSGEPGLQRVKKVFLTRCPMKIQLRKVGFSGFY